MSEEALEPSVAEEGETGLLEAAAESETTSETASAETHTEIDHRDPAELAAQTEDEPLERPDWWPENFWKEDAPDLEGMAKSYQHFRDLVAQGKHKAPEDGKYDTSSFGNTPDTDPVKQHVLNWAKEFGVNQAALDSLVGSVIEMAGDEQERDVFNRDAELKKLGPNANARISNIKKWGEGLKNKGVWSDEDYQEFLYMGGTANGIVALEKVAAAYEGRVPTNTTIDSNQPSKEELYAMVGTEEYMNNPAKRAEVERLFEKFYS